MIGISKLYCGAVEVSDVLRYGRRSADLPSHLLQFAADRRPVVVWNCTRACNLKCRHCYAHAECGPAPDELSGDEAKAMIDDLAAFGCPVLLFSGGEPCLRRDLVELMSYAKARGMRVVLSTNGTLITEELANRFAAVGLSYAGVSIDGTEATHDAFRGVPGSFRRAIEGIRRAKAAGIKVGLRMTLNRGNWREIPDVFALMRREGVDRACFYHLVYAGRGGGLVGEDLPAADCRAAVRTIMDETKAWFADGGRPEILTVDNHADGPFVYLELLKEDPRRAAEVLELLKMNRGNSSGNGIGCVSWDGEVHADQFWRHQSFGNVRRRKFSEIWSDTGGATPESELMRRLKDKRPFVKGRCATCRWLDVCGGNFRVRAEAATGDLWAPDPACYLTDGEISGEERPPVPGPRLVAWELTRRCNLRCRHCRASAGSAPCADELTLEEAKALVDGIASVSKPILILTGGEPLLCDYIWEIVDYAKRKGLTPVIGTNGTLIDDAVAARIASAGVRRISVSLDFPTAAEHDGFRGVKGAFESALRGIRAAIAAGVEVQVNSTITRLNHTELPRLHDLAVELGAKAFHPFLLVPTGRGADLAAQELSAAEYEEALAWVARKSADSPLELKPTDAPQYQRILRQTAAPAGRASCPGGAGRKGCLAGTGFCFISHTGDVQPCGYFDLRLGNVRRTPFARIWSESPAFDDLRHPERLKGKCGVCEFKPVCGGCRARALAKTGDCLAEEPFCAHVPQRRLLDRLQSAFPLAERPYVVLGEALGMSEEACFEQTRRLRDAGLVRRVGASFDSHRLGYVSTLVAAKVAADRLDAVAEKVNAHPSVTHNYARSGELNLWFTLITRTEEARESVLREVAALDGVVRLMELPAERTYKLRAMFGANAEEQVSRTAPETSPREPDVRPPVSLVRKMQGDVLDFGLTPFAAGELDAVRALLADGTIRRFGAILNHRRVGLTANALTAWEIPAERLDAVGAAFAEKGFVTHCYARRHPSDWPYALYAMIHAGSARELSARLEELSATARESVGAEVRFASFETLREYKKVSMSYFTE